MYLNIPQTIFRYFTIIPHPREFYQPSSETPYPQVAVETSARCSLCKYLLASFAERAFTVPSDFPVPREASPATRRLPARGDAESHILTGRDTCNANALKKSVSRAAFFDQPAFTRGCSRINSAEGPCRGEKGTLLLLASTREHWSDAEREAFPAASARSIALPAVFPSHPFPRQRFPIFEESPSATRGIALFRRERNRRLVAVHVYSSSDWKRVLSTCWPPFGCAAGVVCGMTVCRKLEYSVGTVEMIANSSFANLIAYLLVEERGRNCYKYSVAWPSESN